MFADMPDTKELMRVVRERIQKRLAKSKLTTGHQKYIAELVTDEAYSDVEKLYDGAERMVNTKTPNCLPITASLFVGAYESRMNDTYNTYYGDIINELIVLLRLIRRTIFDKFQIDPNVTDAIERLYGLVWNAMEHDKHDEFLVFTTNYDTVLEKYAVKQGMVVVNGFVSGDHLQNIWADIWARHADKINLHLVKLHGSVSWYRDVDGSIREIGGIQHRGARRDVMIAPTEGHKDYSKEPFPALLNRFEHELNNVNVLLVIGFSFRDDYIVSKIKQRLDAGMVLVSVSPTAAIDIQRLTDTKPTVVDADFGIQTVGENIILCEQKFDPENDDLHPSLSNAYEIAKTMLGAADNVQSVTRL